MRGIGPGDDFHAALDAAIERLPRENQARGGAVGEQAPVAIGDPS
jgi:hypothetical protein